MTPIKKALAAARECGMVVPVIPPQRNRKVAREYDDALYQARHQVENGFSKLQGVAWCGDALCQECGVIPGDLPDTALALWAKII